MEKYSFFNDVNNDRVYFAEDFARHLAKFFTNGIFNNSCQVIANDDMTVTVQTGSANINGYRYDNESPKTLRIENADGVLNRIDNVVIRWNLIERTITTQVVQGTFSAEPIAPELVRNSNVYDLRIATISIPAGTTTITQDLITDTRFITSDCGDVICAVETPDTENLFIQLQAIFDKKITTFTNDFDTWFTALKNKTNTDVTDLEKFIEDSKNDFNTWFDNTKKSFTQEATEYQEQSQQLFDEWFANIKDTLSDDVAGALLNKINAVDEKVKNINIPTKTSDLENDSKFISKENDPTVPSCVKSISQQDITNWNNKPNTSQIPTQLSQLTNNLLNQSSNEESAITSSGSNVGKFYFWSEE